MPGGGYAYAGPSTPGKRIPEKESSPLPDLAPPLVPEKSPNDKYEYQLLSLGSGLEALLVSSGDD